MKRNSSAGILLVLVIASAAALVYVDFRATSRAGDTREVLDIMYFHGGYGVEFIEDVGREFEQLHPDVRVKIWASPRIAEKIRLRLLSGDPPDIAFPGWGLDADRVIEAGLLYDLQPDLDKPSYAVGQFAKLSARGKEPWEKDFYPGILDRYRFGRRTYAIPVFYGTSVFWYNKDMFEKHGWKPPATWDEFVSLCARIKAEGIAPIALQGRYIGYLGGVFLSLLDKTEEPGFVESANMLTPGCWSRPSVVEAARRIQDLFTQGYFQPGCLGMSHTEAQMEFLQGRAAMVWCGTWFSSEMREVIPKGFHYACFGAPVVEGGKGDQTMLEVFSEHAFVCAGSKHPALAVEFLRFMCSPKVAAKFVTGREALTSIREANEDAPDSLKPVVDLLRRARSFRSPTPHGNPYPSWEFVFNSGLTDLVTRPAGGDRFLLTPEQFAEQLERKAEGLRREKAGR
ncbi:MAG: extracellular solute-binding protein [Planctomycetota bacterium]|nr:extracellular solute-binding protein [Planctomycetota bacterium]